MQRLANSLSRRRAADGQAVGSDTTGEETGGEASAVRATCSGMASRLSELDPMHGRFYEFVERGGSVWGMGRAKAADKERG